MKKLFHSLLLVVSLLVGLLPAYSARVLAVGELPDTLSVEPSPGNGLPAGIDLYAADGTAYYLFLPGNVSVSACHFSWAGGLLASDGKSEYASGALPVPAPGQTKTFRFTNGAQSTAFAVTTYQGSPGVAPVFMEIDESEGHNSIAQMHADPDHETACDGVIYIDGIAYEMPSVKGRGNATWYMANEKRSYNVTLDKKAVILGLDCQKTKKWSFLANISDHSLLRNKVGMDLAHEMGVGQDSASVDLWINGDYRGVYLVTSKTDSYITDDGYALENDNYRDKPVEQGGDPYFDLDGLVYTVKKIGKTLLTLDGAVDESPANLIRMSSIIQDYMRQAIAAARAADGFDGIGKYYTDYFDLRSWASMYLLHEYVKSFDVCGGSLLFHRDGTADGDKLIAGPLWDLDNALGSTQNNPSLGNLSDLRKADGAFISALPQGTTALLHTLGQHPDFMNEVNHVYNLNRASFNTVPQRVRSLAQIIHASAEMNFHRIRRENYDTSFISGSVTFAEGTDYEHTYRSTSCYDDYVENLITFTSTRSAFLNDQILDDSVSYPVKFQVSGGCSVTAFDTADCLGTGQPEAHYAYARDPFTGEYDKTGSGAVCFRLELPAGYRLESLRAEPALNYATLVGPDAAGCYRLSGVTGSVTVSISAEPIPCAHEFADGVCSLCGKPAFRADFVCGKHGSVFADGAENAAFAYARRANGSIDVSGEGQISFKPAVAQGFKIKAVTAQPRNYGALEGPDADGVYCLTGVSGAITVRVETAPDIPDGSVTIPIDFTTIEDAEKYQIINPDTAAVAPGQGLTLVSTKSSFETACGQLSGDAATNPKDLVYVPVNGNWTATLTFHFSKAGAADGYYQFFGFYAMQDYQNCVGIRCGEGAMQDFLRIDGGITSETKNAMSGVNKDGSYRLRIVCSGDDYSCFGAEGTADFTPLFSFENTGIDAAGLALDAYTGMTAGYEFTLTSLLVEGMGCTHSFDGNTVPSSCTEGGYTVYTCTKCGGSYTDDQSAPLGHDLSETTTLAACETAGAITTRCSRCDYLAVTKLAPLGHDLSETTTPAACETAGAITTRCSRCDYLELTELPLLGHTPVGGVCTRCGAFVGCSGAVDCASNNYTDVPGSSDWAHSGIDYCIGRGLMRGTSASVFAPNGPLTRAQLVAILYRVQGVPAVDENYRFLDVSADIWYADAVAWAAANGIVEGIGDGRFDPDGKITREQIAVILYRFCGAPAVSGSLTRFPDASKVSAYAHDAMLWATGTGLLRGVASNGAACLAPGSNATRAQAAALVLRCFEDK